MNTDNCWVILFLLFAVRLSMAFQFQSAAAIAPMVMNEFGVGLGDVGLLISLYPAPGLVIALPGGEIGRCYGDKSAVLFGLALKGGPDPRGAALAEGAGDSCRSPPFA